MMWSWGGGVAVIILALVRYLRQSADAVAVLLRPPQPHSSGTNRRKTWSQLKALVPGFCRMAACTMVRNLCQSALDWDPRSKTDSPGTPGRILLVVPYN